VHRYANPTRFLKIARVVTPIVALLGMALTAAGLWIGLFASPPDYQQGESVRIMYVHVPAAWLGAGGYMSLAIASATALIWRHPLATIAARAIAPAGAAFTAICLISGSLWGKPTWGTYWVWDARLTSMLILLFLYLGSGAVGKRSGKGRRSPRLVHSGAGWRDQLADHQIFGGMVEHTAPGQQHFGGQRLVQDRAGLADAAAAVGSGLFLPVCRHRPDADAGDAGAAAR
jgi:ABC-type transport system involved in cytochrome c biogenesis permease subunit